MVFSLIEDKPPTQKCQMKISHGYQKERMPNVHFALAQLCVCLCRSYAMTMILVHPSFAHWDRRDKNNDAENEPNMKFNTIIWSCVNLPIRLPHHRDGECDWDKEEIFVFVCKLDHFSLRMYCMFCLQCESVLICIDKMPDVAIHGKRTQ